MKFQKLMRKTGPEATWLARLKALAFHGEPTISAREGPTAR